MIAALTADAAIFLSSLGAAASEEEGELGSLGLRGDEGWLVRRSPLKAASRGRAVVIAALTADAAIFCQTLDLVPMIRGGGGPTAYK